jgi:hypothetical protein
MSRRRCPCPLPRTRALCTEAGPAMPTPGRPLRGAQASRRAARAPMSIAACFFAPQGRPRGSALPHGLTHLPCLARGPSPLPRARARSRPLARTQALLPLALAPRADRLRRPTAHQPRRGRPWRHALRPQPAHRDFFLPWRLIVYRPRDAGRSLLSRGAGMRHSPRWVGGFVAARPKLMWQPMHGPCGFSATPMCVGRRIRASRFFSTRARMWSRVAWAARVFRRADGPAHRCLNPSQRSRGYPSLPTQVLLGPRRPRSS